MSALNPLTWIAGDSNMPKIKKRVATMVKTGTVMLDCMFCRSPTRTDAQTTAVLCGNCTAKLCDAPVQPRPVLTATEQELRRTARARATEERAAHLKAHGTAGRGRGWHLKKLFEWNGAFYSFGTLISAERARELQQVNT
jgi:hypothetical protein